MSPTFVAIHVRFLVLIVEDGEHFFFLGGRMVQPQEAHDALATPVLTEAPSCPLACALPQPNKWGVDMNLWRTPC
jgi:hypothetical protein